MSAIDVQGIWWLPNRPEERLYGKLACSEDDHLTLHVMGGFRQIQFQGGQNEIVLLGEADHPDGPDVTLTNCRLVEQVFSGEAASARQVFAAQKGFFGAHLETARSIVFRGAEMSFSGLSPWAYSLSGFRSGSGRFSISWDPPPTLSVRLPEGELLLRLGSKFSQTRRERHLYENIGLSLNFHQDVRESELNSKFVYPLQNFFSFATDRPNALTTLRVTTDTQEPGRVVVRGSRTFTDASEAADVDPSGMLFTLGDLGDLAGNVLSRWLELSRQYFKSFAVYFGSRYRPPGYTDVRCNLIMNVLTIYQTSRGRPAVNTSPSAELFRQVSSRLPREIAQPLELLLQSHPVVALENALGQLIEEHGNEFAPLVAIRPEAGTSRFQTHALNTLRYLLTRDPLHGASPPDGADLHWLAEILAFLFKISILKDLGIPGPAVKKILDRNSLYTHIVVHVLPRATWATGC